MLPSTSPSLLKEGVITFLFVSGFFILASMYLGHPRSHTCRPPPLSKHSFSQAEPRGPSGPSSTKPVLLIWFWPEGLRFDPADCQREFGIDECVLTDERSCYENAEAVLIYHRAISADLSNLPPMASRPPFQRWIWYNVDPPPRTQNLTNVTGFFNLTMSYRKDADITVRVRVLTRKTPQEVVVPDKTTLLCWVSNEEDLGTEAKEYYSQIENNVSIELYGTAFKRPLTPLEYYPTMSRCKFHLSFENSIYPDYITNTMQDALASGTVPIVLGPPRKNYEDFFPRNSFLHVNDFSGPEALLKMLAKLDSDPEAYKQFFAWRSHLYAVPRLQEKEKRFLHDVCLACRYVGRKRVYRRVHDVYRWFYTKPVWMP